MLPTDARRLIVACDAGNVKLAPGVMRIAWCPPVAPPPPILPNAARSRVRSILNLCHLPGGWIIALELGDANPACEVRPRGLWQ
ncbi:MAG: hypothetical protein ACE5E6_06345 [Phycisphaerae bacterium]